MIDLLLGILRSGGVAAFVERREVVGIERAALELGLLGTVTGQDPDPAAA
jgi:hypothetical protein